MPSSKGKLMEEMVVLSIRITVLQDCVVVMEVMEEMWWMVRAAMQPTVFAVLIEAEEVLQQELVLMLTEETV